MHIIIVAYFKEKIKLIVPQYFLNPLPIAMPQYPQIRLQTLIKRFFRNYLVSQIQFFAFYFFDHSSFGFCPQDSVMWQNNITKKIDALMIFSDEDFIWMKI